MKNNVRKLFVSVLFLIFAAVIFAGCGGNKHLTKSRDLFRDKDLKGAIDEAKLAVKQDPKNTEALSFLGKLYFEDKNYDESIDAYKREIEVVPTDIQAHYNVAKVYKEKAAFDDAIVHFKKVIELNPKGKLARESEKLISECESGKSSAASAPKQNQQVAGGVKGQPDPKSGGKPSQPQKAGGQKTPPKNIDF